MSVEAIMEAPADPEAGAREPEVEAELTRALAAATTAEERGRLYDELARHYARRTKYRAMNRAEKASMQAYAEGPNGAPFAEALALYEQAMKAFGDRDDARGVDLLREARALALVHLPLRHSWVLRVTSTLAGRLRGSAAPEVLAEVVELREHLEREAIESCGPDHHSSLQDASALAYAYKSIGRYEEALSRFERCFRAYVTSPRMIHEAGVLLVPIAALFRAIGDPEGVAPFEDELLSRAPTSFGVVQRSRFERAPELRAELDRRAVEHAAPHFVGRASAAVFATAVAKLDDPTPSYFTAANDVYAAMLALERELGIVPEEDDEEEDVTYEHPLCDAESAFQNALYEELWTKREAERLSR